MIGLWGKKNIVIPASQVPKSFLFFFALSATYSFRGLLTRTKSLEKFKSLSTRGPGRLDTCHLTDFSQTFTDD